MSRYVWVFSSRDEILVIVIIIIIIIIIITTASSGESFMRCDKTALLNTIE